MTETSTPSADAARARPVPAGHVLDWSQPQRCRNRAVHDRQGRRIGRIDMVLSAPDGSQDVFCILVLGSVSRLGNEARAVPVTLLAEAEPDGIFVLRCEAEAVFGAPLYVEGARCSCAAWFGRVREHFAAFASPGSSSGKTPHSSSP